MSSALSRRGRAVVVAALGVAIGASPASADVPLGPRAATSIDAYAGVQVWDEPRGGEDTWRLYRRIGGVTRAVPVRRSEQPFEADLGPRRGGGVIAVYQRCTTDERCAIYSYDFARARERREARVHRKGCEEAHPSYWRGTVAFVRLGRRCRPGLYVRGAGRKARARRISKLRARATDLRGRLLLWGDSDECVGSQTCAEAPITTRVGALAFSGRRRTLARSRDVSLVGYDGPYAYLLERQGEATPTSSPRSFLVRVSLTTGTRTAVELSGQQRFAASAAVDGGRFFYTLGAPGRPFEASVFPFAGPSASLVRGGARVG